MDWLMIVWMMIGFTLGMLFRTSSRWDSVGEDLRSMLREISDLKAGEGLFIFVRKQDDSSLKGSSFTDFDKFWTRENN